MENLNILKQGTDRGASPAYATVQQVMEATGRFYDEQLLKDYCEAHDLDYITVPTKAGKNVSSRDLEKTFDFTDETKSKRLNLLLYPSLLEDLKKIAIMQRTSVNDLINTVLDQYAEKESNQIKRYNQTFEE